MALPPLMQAELFLRVLVGAALCGLIGLERERRGQVAGLRTHMLVGMGAALFTALSIHAFAQGDPARVAAQVVTGIGFLGAGAILQRSDRRAHGLTTAAGIWFSAAIGMAAGSALYVVAALSALLGVVVLAVLAPIGERIRPKNREDAPPA
ncbi:MAG: MgtC/SapB family protein [Anaerolineae bacterium]|nr:MgtC/SapB family protein [Thermoflexales bacterium]MDW8395414.1 MgtC/SapB family protein [Anaerolineae bacterium]